MWDVRPFTILNSLSRVHAIGAGTDPAIPTADTGLAVDRSNKFGVSEVTKIYKRASTAAVKEVADILVTDTLTAGLYRFVVDTELSMGSATGDYARFLTYKGRPLYTEFNLTSTVTVKTGFAPYLKLINRELKREEIIDAVVTQTEVAGSPATQHLVITAGNEYIRFKSVTLEKYNTTTNEFESIATNTITTAGAEGFGTYDFMVKNISLPTDVKLNFTAINKDELPVVGFTYNQYSIFYKKPYPVPTGIVQGVFQDAQAIQVYWVRNDLVTAFEALVTANLAGKMATV